MTRFKLNIIYPILVAITSGFYFQACTDDLLSSDNTIEFSPTLSTYGIFKGKFSDLTPTDSFKHYSLASQLFTDYAEKQRLIKIPAGTALSAVDNGLLDFPTGTMLVKTFFYFNNKRDTAKGKQIIETRLLIKSEDNWNVGVYQWNDRQTDATLLTMGLNKTINWIDMDGGENSITYHIPNNNECATCHNSNSTVTPIGLKTRNLNINVLRNNRIQNQLDYFHEEGILNSVDPTSFETLPDYTNTTVSLEKRARAYFEINCSHCHKEGGFNGSRSLYLGYEKSYLASDIKWYQNLIVLRMDQGRMPKLGTTVVHKEGLSLIKAYVNSLP